MKKVVVEYIGEREREREKSSCQVVEVVIGCSGSQVDA